MAHEIGRGESTVPRRSMQLPDPFYYLNNFRTVISSLEQRYAKLLCPEEREFIAHFGALPQASCALLVRMVMRARVFFRGSRLRYSEIGEISSAAAPLVEAGWIDECPVLDVDQLQRLLTKAELLHYFGLPRQYLKFKKPDLVACLRTQHPASKPFSAWCKESSECVYRLNVAPLCERLRLMFFGNFHQDWTEFVLTDLGLFTYEKVPAPLHSLAFRTRAHVDAFQQLHRGREWLDAGTELDEVRAAIPPPIIDCDWLEDCRQKMLYQTARAYEQRGDMNTASAMYLQCTHRDARVRRIRLLERAHQCEEARDLCLAAMRDPLNEAERQQIQRLLPRLDRKLGISSNKKSGRPAVSAFEMLLDRPAAEYAIEHVVRDRLAQQAEMHSTVHYVENGLVNSLFGLLCWKAIFAAIPGAFFHDFQYGPADLSSGHFFQRRSGEFAECFAELDSDRYRETIWRNFAVKSAVQSPFVTWGLLNEKLLGWALRCLPAAHLRLWFEWIVRDVRMNRAGFPDLVQFWPHERRYRMVEVKGPGDRLQDNQRRLLEFCASHQMPVSVCYVRWRPD